MCGDGVGGREEGEQQSIKKNSYCSGYVGIERIFLFFIFGFDCTMTKSHTKRRLEEEEVLWRRPFELFVFLFHCPAKKKSPPT